MYQSSSNSQVKDGSVRLGGGGGGGAGAGGGGKDFPPSRPGFISWLFQKFFSKPRTKKMRNFTKLLQIPKLKVVRLGGGGGRQSTVVAFAFPALPSWVQFLAIPKIYFDAAESYRWCWLKKSGPRVDQIYLVLASGN